MRHAVMARRKEPIEGRSSPGKPPGGQAQGKPSRAFDVWLDRGLHEMYDSIAQEPIPDDLLRLIEEDRKK